MGHFSNWTPTLLQVGVLLLTFIISFPLQSNATIKPAVLTPGPPVFRSTIRVPISPFLSPLQTIAPRILISHLGCLFTTKTCSWENVNKWTWEKPTYAKIKIDSPVPHPSNLYFLQINFNSPTQFDLTSPQFTLPGNVACFSFDYYFYVDSNHLNFINIFLVDPTKSSPAAKDQKLIWSTSETNADEWSNGEVQIDQPGTYKIKVHTIGQRGFIAVSNFLLRNRECPTRVCNFELGTCGWTSDGTPSNYIFNLKSANINTGKLKNDHTSRSPYGNVALLSNFASQATSVAHFKSPPMASLQSQCFTFWFARSGSGVNLKLYKYHLNTKVYDLIWQNNSTHVTDEWVRVQNSLQITDQVNLVFEAKNTDTTSTLMLDDVGLTPFACNPPINCLFSDGFCGWKAETTKSNLLWAIGHGRVRDPTRLTDQNVMSGSDVLYTDFTSSGLGQASMELMSEFVDAPALGGACVSMNYHVKSFSLNSDTFQLVQIDINGIRTVVWNYNATKLSSFWQTLPLYVPNPANNLPYRLSLYVKSNNPGPYIGVRTFYYTTNLFVCGHSPNNAPTTTSTLPTVSPSKSLACDFEQNNLCNWHSPSGTFQLGTPRDSKIPNMYLPPVDHTRNSRIGHFAFTYGDKPYLPTSGSLQADIPFPNQQICFGFYYYFYAYGTSNFVLSMDFQSKPLPIFRVNAANEIKWRRAQFAVSPNSTYDKFTFSSSVKQGVLAIDDINVSPGACPTTDNERHCDFELGTTCIFEPVFNAIGMWKVLPASIAIYDHTTHSRDGHYYGMAFRDLQKSPVRRRFMIESRRIDGSTLRCLRFSYYLDNVLPNTTLFYEVGPSGPVFDPNTGASEKPTRWQTAGSTVGMWFTHRTPLPRYSSINIWMGIEVVGDADGKVLVDDIFLDSTSCNNPHNCDFENGDVCSLETVLITGNALATFVKTRLINNANFTSITTRYLADFVTLTWHVFTPLQSSNFATFDNTYRSISGKYLLLTSVNSKDRGIMVTERYSLAEHGGQICFSFAVYKSSAQSVLELYQGESFNDQLGLKIWDIHRTTKNWEMFEILATPQRNDSVDIYFYIVGTLQDLSTFIALDDITIKPKCNYPSNILPTTVKPTGSPVTGIVPTTDPTQNGAYFVCTAGKRIPSAKACDWVQDCPNGEDEKYCGMCQFENHNMCRYTIESVFGNFAFRFRDAVQTIGPRNGFHGNALFMMASGNSGRSSMASPIIHQTYLTCKLTFYYYYSSNEVTNNQTSSDMTVSLELTDLNRKTKIWQSSYAPIDKLTWERVTLKLDRIKHPFRIVFSASNSDLTPQKYHVIDFISMSNCEPVKPSTMSTCRQAQFKCDNNACVDLNDLCDFEDDCDDGSDERNCDQSHMTSFENGRGLWGASIFKGWSVTNANFGDLRLGPTYDHTSAYVVGSYLYATARYYGANRTVIAEIDSPPFKANSNCAIRYFVFKNTGHSTFLAILENMTTGKRYKINEISDYDDKWLMYNRVLSGYSDGVFRVIFTATLNATSGTFVDPYIAVDDISFSPQCIFTNGPVTPPINSTISTPPPDNCPTISCLDSQAKKICLRANQFCDFVTDCKDGTDEQNCGDCNFENGRCGWSSVPSFVKRWFLLKPASSSAASLPKFDADGKGTGGYLTISSDSFSSSMISYAILRGPQINAKSAPSCKIQFSFMSSKGATLNVRRNTNGRVNVLNNLRTASQWQSYRVDVGSEIAGFRLEFAGYSTNRIGSRYEDIALDNIKMIDCNPAVAPPTVSPGTPGASVSCDFEQDMCGWRVIGITQRSNWIRINNPHMEPGNDHTSLTKPLSLNHGTWLTTQASLGYDTDYLVTVLPLKAGKTYCFTFWYYFLGIYLDSKMALYASKSGKAQTNPETNPDYQQLWFTNTPQSRNWNQRYVEIGAQQNDFYLVFVANVDTTTVIGLDDIALSDGSCPVVSAEFCDFEVNTCDWKLQSNGWQLNTAKYIDHTTGTINGHFMQDSVQSQSVAMTKAMSTMPIYNNTQTIDRQQFCLQFYYYMTTEFADKQMLDSSSMLSVKIKNGANVFTQNITILSTFNDGLLNTWTLFSMTFVSYRASTVEIDGLNIFVASTMLLVDDIRFTQRYCQVQGNCDFEADMCGWSNAQTSSNGKRVLWLRIKPNSRFIKGSLLKYDHTTMSSNGNYIIMPLAMSNNAYSALKSPLMRQKSKVICFSMWYFAQATNSSIVALTVRLVDITRQKTTAVQVNASPSFAWKQFSTEFTNLPTAFVIQIEGNYIQDIQTDIGIDDIKIVPFGCGGQAVPTTTTQVPPTEKVLDCTFDNGQCNWSYDQKAWKVGRFIDQQNNYAPKMDHTIQSTSGKYLMFQQQPTGIVQTSFLQESFKLSSTQNLTFDKDHCVTVWYYEDGEVPFTLDVFIVLPTNIMAVNRYSSAIENRRRWNLLKADIPFSASYNAKSIQVQFRFATDSSPFFIFALDDIMIRPGKCQHKHDYVYTFTNGFEDLELEFIQPIQMPIGQLFAHSSDHTSVAPSVDHTTNTESGHYFLFMNQKNFAPTTYIDSLSLTDLSRDSPTASCIRFAYQIYGNVSLKVKIAPANSDTVSFNTLYWQPQYDKTTWTIMEINKRVLYDHKVMFEMTKPPDKTSFVALDDLTVLSHRCQDLINCDFEDGRVCSYSPFNDKTTSQYNFGLFQAPPQDPSWPGPKYDHTTKNYGSGYLYLTAYRSTGSLTSPLLSKVISGPRNVDPTQKYCLTVWTRMTSNDLGLKLYLVRFGQYWTDANRTTTIASMSNLAQPDWTRVAVTLDQNTLVNTYEVQLLIEGQINVNSKGLIAIDDIVLMQGQCQTDGVLCENGVQLTRDKICNFVKDCPSGLDEINCGNCDFESGTCGWMNMTTVDQKWLLTNVKESRKANAPAFDGNANPNGHYLMMSAPVWGVLSNAETALNYQTPSMYLKNAFKSCVMQFDYYIQSASSYRLQVRIGRDLADWATIYTITQQQSNGGWRKAYAHIGERFSQFMMDIVGYQDSGRTGIIAIDNIQFFNCSVPKPLGPNEKCSDSQIMCTTNRFCVSKDDVCDYVNDCGDGTDEMGCVRKWVRCNFEYSLASCSIKTDVMLNQGSNGANVAWILKQARLNHDAFEPTVDNTRHDGYGHYLVLETSQLLNKQTKMTNTADFYSPMLTSQNQQNCRMRYFYFINGEPASISQTHLDIYIQYANKLQPEAQPISTLSMSIQGDLQQRWNKAVAQFQSTQPFQFVFRGHIGTNLSRIAVDDISFDLNCVESMVQPLTTTTQPPQTNANTGNTNGNPVTVTNMPTITREKDKSSGGKVAAGILIPLFFVLAAVGAFFAYRKYQESHRSSDNIVLSMKNIHDDHK